MEPIVPPKDPMLQATLRQMADIALPPPVSMIPATWGWAILAALVLLAFAFILWRWLHRRAENRYRRDAVAEIAQLEARIANEVDRMQALAALPVIVKRTALAAWPREQVAALSGASWIEFLRAHAGKAKIGNNGYDIFAEAEYRLAISTPDEPTARRSFAAARQWIEGHDVHP